MKLTIAFLLFGALPPQDGTWWPPAVDKALARAGQNAERLRSALRGTPESQREGMAFLIANMPDRDLRSLSGEFLLRNVRLAYDAIHRVPWGKSIPKEVFLNDVLPYANVNEKREDWRSEFFERFLPLVADCKTPGEAAKTLNAKVFGMLGVRYSRKRKKPDQSPSESMETGLASCTGLSIVLADACRAVGIPARLTGIARWVNKRGNHTWVEIWDRGWHFTGACEPNDLDKTWFEHDASLAKRDERLHAIWAASFRKTGAAFPMVWAPRNREISAVNVTDRYTKQGQKQAKRSTVRLLVRVLDRPRGARVAASVVIRDTSDPEKQWTGTSRDESNDANDYLTFELPPSRSYVIRAKLDKRSARQELHCGEPAQELVELHLKAARATRLAKQARNWFETAAEERRLTTFEEDLEQWLAKDDARVRAIVWQAFRQAKVHADLGAAHATRRVRSGQHESRYSLKNVGRMPKGGWPLFIAMHGGGGVPKEANDRNWRRMQKYYRDQNGVEGYAYVALRAPNDKWNGFYDHYVWPLVTRLIRQLVICENINPSRVYLLGYSHGGYGAFAIGSNIPDRFAAVHASAAAPTPGITPAANLRNTVFTFMIGERDTRHERRTRCEAFAVEVARLRGDRKDVFPVTMEFQKGFGHGGLPDRDKIRSMYGARRVAAPRELTWHVTGRTSADFFWLSVRQPRGGQTVTASCIDNRLALKTKDVTKLDVGLDGRLVDFGREVDVSLNGKSTRMRLRPRLATLCASIERRADPQLAFTARIELDAGSR